MHLLIPHTLCSAFHENEFARVGATTISDLDSTQVNHHGWPVASSVRKVAGEGPSVAVTASVNVKQVESLLHALQDLRTDASAVMVCGCEPIPSDLRANIPASLHGLLRRPQPTDLIFLTAELLNEALANESVLDVALRHNAIGLAVRGPVESSRLPEPGPGRPTVELSALRAAIQQALAEVQAGEMQRKCLEAGLLLLWDFLDESHAISQTMEGKGTPRTADYWHAIMHRREPDLGNAAYWFRRLGNHPAFESMGSRLPDWLRDTSSPAEEHSRALDSVLESGTFAPLAMIELCRAAQKAPSTAAADSYRRIQYLELLNLLLHPYSRTSGAG